MAEGFELIVNNDTISFLISWIFLFLFSLLVSFFWLMSPLGIGFNYDSQMSASQIKLGEVIYSISYFIGIPVLLGIQVLSGIVGFRGKRRKAIKLSILTLITFIGMVILSLAILT